ncbi:hypothetical protein EGW08_001824 [Elysia chlorotica]|uniref:Uncharacterized protein n=1 Tax=Elysia chlorotica TaxID=188477 RepID=A0A3S1I1J8_ELYCH|nr:hypothetical protein EGW08_001824 [Elysia chlorotica]
MKQKTLKRYFLMEIVFVGNYYGDVILMCQICKTLHIKILCKSKALNECEIYIRCTNPPSRERNRRKKVIKPSKPCLLMYSNLHRSEYTLPFFYLIIHAFKFTQKNYNNNIDNSRMHNYDPGGKKLENPFLS